MERTIKEIRKHPFVPPEARLFLFALAGGAMGAALLATAVAVVLISSGRHRTTTPWLVDIADNGVLLTLAIQYTTQFLPYTVLAAAVCTAAVSLARRLARIQRDLGTRLDAIAAAYRDAALARPGPPGQESAVQKELNLELDR